MEFNVRGKGQERLSLSASREKCSNLDRRLKLAFYFSLVFFVSAAKTMAKIQHLSHQAVKIHIGWLHQDWILVIHTNIVHCHTDPTMTVRADINGRYSNRMYTYEPNDYKLCK